MRSATRVEDALRRLLWIAVADDVQSCSCEPGDPGPYCYAWQVLGYGKHWPGAKRAARKLKAVRNA